MTLYCIKIKCSNGPCLLFRMLQFENIDKMEAKAYVKKPRLGSAKRPFSQLANQRGSSEGDPKAKKARSGDVAPDGLQGNSGRKLFFYFPLTKTDRLYDMTGGGRRGQRSKTNNYRPKATEVLLGSGDD